MYTLYHQNLTSGIKLAGHVGRGLFTTLKYIRLNLEQNKLKANECYIIITFTKVHERRPSIPSTRRRCLGKRATRRQLDGPGQRVTPRLNWQRQDSSLLVRKFVIDYFSKIVQCISASFTYRLCAFVHLSAMLTLILSVRFKCYSIIAKDINLFFVSMSTQVSILLL